MTAPWQNDWKAFLDTVAKYLQSSVDLGTLMDVFNSKLVSWRGTLIRKNLNRDGGSVVISMPDAVIDIGEVESIPLGNLSIPVARDTVNGWPSIEVGNEIDFTATLGGGFNFPAVDVIRLESDGGRTLVMLRLRDARPSV